MNEALFICGGICVVMFLVDAFDFLQFSVRYIQYNTTVI